MYVWALLSGHRPDAAGDDRSAQPENSCEAALDGVSSSERAAIESSLRSLSGRAPTGVHVDRMVADAQDVCRSAPSMRVSDAVAVLYTAEPHWYGS